MQRGSNRFVAEFDPQLFHLDEVAARSTIFKGLSPSGCTRLLFYAALMTGAPTYRQRPYWPGWGVDVPKPTRPGDTLRVESEIVEILPSRSKPNQGVPRSEAQH